VLYVRNVVVSGQAGFDLRKAKSSLSRQAGVCPRCLEDPAQNLRPNPAHSEPVEECWRKRCAICFDKLSISGAGVNGSELMHFALA